MRYRFDPRKLLQWSCSDLPLILAGAAALFSWASMPEYPAVTDPRAEIEHGLDKVVFPTDSLESLRRCDCDRVVSVSCRCDSRNVNVWPSCSRTSCHWATSQRIYHWLLVYPRTCETDAMTFFANHVPGFTSERATVNGATAQTRGSLFA